MRVKHKQRVQLQLQKRLEILQVKKKHATQKMTQKLILMRLVLMKLFNILHKKNQVFYISDFQVVLGVKKQNPF